MQTLTDKLRVAIRPKPSPQEQLAGTLRAIAFWSSYEPSGIRLMWGEPEAVPWLGGDPCFWFGLCRDLECSGSLPPLRVPPMPWLHGSATVSFLCLDRGCFGEHSLNVALGSKGLPSRACVSHTGARSYGSCSPMRLVVTEIADV